MIWNLSLFSLSHLCSNLVYLYSYILFRHSMMMWGANVFVLKKLAQIIQMCTFRQLRQINGTSSMVSTSFTLYVSNTMYWRLADILVHLFYCSQPNCFLTLLHVIKYSQQFECIKGGGLFDNWVKEKFP